MPKTATRSLRLDIRCHASVGNHLGNSDVVIVNPLVLCVILSKQKVITNKFEIDLTPVGNGKRSRRYFI